MPDSKHLRKPTPWLDPNVHTHGLTESGSMDIPLSQVKQLFLLWCVHELWCVHVRMWEQHVFVLHFSTQII